MKKLNWIEITALYIGTIMGAGFASGRECWQFFGVFGNMGYYGAAIFTIGFILVSLMLTYIARSKNTNQLGKLISPFNNRIIDAIPGNILALSFFADLIVMSAAGGSLLNQQFGLHKAIGGLLIVVLALITVLGDYDRISSVFKYLVPVLFTSAVVMIILIIRADYDQSGTTEFEPGAMSPNWLASALVFISYNGMGLPAIIGNSAPVAKSRKHAYIGAIVGSLCLGGLTIALMKALTSDMAFTDSCDLPLLGYSIRLSPVLNAVYAIILFGSIYSTGSSLYCGFTTVFPETERKKYVTAIGALLGFGLGLTGFKNLIEYLYPIQGYIGYTFIIMITINFFKELIRNRKFNNT